MDTTRIEASFPRLEEHMHLAGYSLHMSEGLASA